MAYTTSHLGIVSHSLRRGLNFLTNYEERVEVLMGFVPLTAKEIAQTPHEKKN